jgi:intracellular multiplication protein IcmL
MNANDVMVMVFSRNAFYRLMHFLALGALVLAWIVIGLLIWVLYFLINNPSQPVYFATDSVGRLIHIIPVNRPNMSTEAVTNWTINAVQRAYSYDYINFRQQLQSSQKFFTNYGWRNYMEALSASNNLLALTQRKQVVITQVVDQPKIIAQGILAGAYAWKYEMPVLVTYWEPPYDDKSKALNALTVSVIVQRQPILQSYQGLGIIQLIARSPAGSEQPQQLSNTPTG